MACLIQQHKQGIDIEVWPIGSLYSGITETRLRLYLNRKSSTVTKASSSPVKQCGDYLSMTPDTTLRDCEPSASAPCKEVSHA